MGLEIEFGFEIGFGHWPVVFGLECWFCGGLRVLVLMQAWLTRTSAGLGYMSLGLVFGLELRLVKGVGFRSGFVWGDGVEQLEQANRGPGRAPVIMGFCLVWNHRGFRSACCSSGVQ